MTTIKSNNATFQFNNATFTVESSASASVSSYAGTPNAASTPVYTQPSYVPQPTDVSQPTYFPQPRSLGDQEQFNVGTSSNASVNQGIALVQVLLEMIAVINSQASSTVHQGATKPGPSTVSAGYGSSSGAVTGQYVSSNTSDGSSDLAQNKAAILAAAKAQGLSQDKIDTILTIGSIETNDMSASERDASKDGTASANYSAFNLNKGMLEAMGYNPDTGPNLNDPANVGLAVHLMSQAIDKFGENGFLAWQRGGQSGYESGSAYGVQSYIQAVDQGKSEIQSNASLLTDDQRVSTASLAHV